MLQRKSNCACGGGCPTCEQQSDSVKLQTKLALSTPGDAYEQEADAVAEHVMRMPWSNSGALAKGSDVPNVASHSAPGTLHGDSVSTAMHQVLNSPGQQLGLPAPIIQTKNHGSHRGGAPVKPEIVSRINSSRGGGNGLDRETRGFMEGRFGADLGSVRVHTGTEAVRLNRELNARAFTLGSDIYFNEGQYQPSTESGRRLLAHELTHTVQQNREDSKQIQRTPGTDARDSWNDIVRQRFSSARAAEVRPMMEEAINRVLTTADGAALMNNLWRLACRRVRSGRCGVKIHVAFLDEPQFRRTGCATSDADGCFQPVTQDSFPYEVFVKNHFPPDPESRGIRLGMGRYGTGPHQVFQSHVDEESDMASTLFHELLHIEFVNDGLTHLYPTGHGAADAGEIDPDFSDRLQSFEDQLGVLETQIHERARAEAEGAAAPRGLPDLERETTPAPPAPSRPLIGGRLSLGGGYAGGAGIGSSFTGIVGADLILERIAGLGIGGRGVYLSPDRLLAGPALSGRALGEGDSPLFFDIEAGVLFEIPSSTSGRIANTLTGYASAGVGQEFGRSGGRFFWRVGGFVIISDRLDTSTGTGFGGGVTGGGGLRF